MLDHLETDMPSVAAGNLRPGQCFLADGERVQVITTTPGNGTVEICYKSPTEASDPSIAPECVPYSPGYEVEVVPCPE
jgi:hypothetical protein